MLFSYSDMIGQHVPSRNSQVDQILGTSTFINPHQHEASFLQLFSGNSICSAHTVSLLTPRFPLCPAKHLTKTQATRLPRIGVRDSRSRRATRRRGFTESSGGALLPSPPRRGFSLPIPGFGQTWLWHILDRRRTLPEVEISKKLKAAHGTQVGGKYVRLVLDSFQVTGPHGVHPRLLYAPAGIDIRDFMRCLEGDTLPEDILRPTLRFLLVALEYLHRADIIHTDVNPHNILLGIDDDSALIQVEDEEISDPAPRKQLYDRTIYATRAMPLTEGEPTLSDLGEARIAKGRQTGLIMPDVYRAPEVMLRMPWDNKVDIWAVGQVAWTLFERGHLFTTRRLENESDHARRFAEMIALLGLPPPELLQRNEESLKYWDENGTWRGLAEIPEKSLEDREIRLEGENKMRFIRFLQKALHWLPEERPGALDLLADEWMRAGDY
ncbi:kinase-like domain-containing protein [Aspergillus californicus]